MLKKFVRFAKRMKRDIHTLYWASRDPRLPRAARVVTLIVVAYALSPIDLIPDFIPVLGYLDDLLLLPLGLYCAARMVPAAVWAEARARAEAYNDRPPRSRAGFWGVLVIWVVISLAVMFGVYRVLS